MISKIMHFFTVSHPTAMRAMDRGFGSASESRKQPVTRRLAQATTRVCAPTLRGVASCLIVNAMTTVSVVMFLSSPHATPAAVAAPGMDDAGRIRPAAAMCMPIFHGNLAARGVRARLGRAMIGSQA